MKDQEFDSHIVNLDTNLFRCIPTQTSLQDKKSLLDIQNAIRSLKDSYVYLEIGSHLGGSIQPHLLDYKCRKIFSIDNRPLAQPDERWAGGYKYPDNSTQRMFDNLRRLTPDLGKIKCLDSDASDVYTQEITPKPDICFIDGEHTNRKVVSDFEFCKSVLADDGVIIFHDAQVVTEGIALVINGLKKKKTPFKAYYLPSSILVLDFADNGIFFKKLQSRDIKGYAPLSFTEILRLRLRKLPQPLKDIIKQIINDINKP